MEAFQLRAMHKAFIDPEKCGHCTECKAANSCPHKAITRIDSNEPSVVDSTYCRGYGDCIAECNSSAIIKNSIMSAGLTTFWRLRLMV